MRQELSCFLVNESWRHRCPTTHSLRPLAGEISLAGSIPAPLANKPLCAWPMALIASDLPLRHSTGLNGSQCQQLTLIPATVEMVSQAICRRTCTRTACFHANGHSINLIKSYLLGMSSLMSFTARSAASNSPSDYIYFLSINCFPCGFFTIAHSSQSVRPSGTAPALDLGRLVLVR